MLGRPPSPDLEPPAQALEVLPVMQKYQVPRYQAPQHQVAIYQTQPPPNPRLPPTGLPSNPWLDPQAQVPTGMEDFQNAILQASMGSFMLQESQDLADPVAN